MTQSVEDAVVPCAVDDGVQNITVAVVQNEGDVSTPAHLSGSRPEDLAGASMDEEQERALAFDIGRAQALVNDRVPEVFVNGWSFCSRALMIRQDEFLFLGSRTW